MLLSCSLSTLLGGEYSHSEKYSFPILNSWMLNLSVNQCNRGRLCFFYNSSKAESTLLSHILWRSSEVAPSGILWTMSLLPRSWQMSIGGRPLSSLPNTLFTMWCREWSTSCSMYDFEPTNLYSRRHSERLSQNLTWRRFRTMLPFHFKSLSWRPGSMWIPSYWMSRFMASTGSFLFAIVSIPAT